ncbi:ABC transporter permease [Saccharopolyspora sp. HNM0983]|uniref:ABC transporter permease n=2 Tax=Saccharopolyspora montiporae TaxID=2781240 RepID=A0A929B8C9_9PSEU|nr:ABC transporter permease [Saccharopolyspora sp. HNM0983]MBE9373316.1 ABC transporter permease [Saccharopolyspora sp. HNM0983]
MSLDTIRAVFRRPFQLREFLEQTVFLARVTILPCIFLAVPFLGVTIFFVNQLLAQIGAIDLSGAGTALAVVREIGSMASVLVLAGAGSTAICADLASRTIRDEINAMAVLGVDAIHRLVVPRVLATTLLAVGLNAVVCVVGISTGYVFSVLLQGASAGQFVANLPLLVGLADVVVGVIKAVIFGLAAGLVGCYRGLTVGSGAKGVGEAVNETVVLVVSILFVVNTIITLIYMELGGRSGF